MTLPLFLKLPRFDNGAFRWRLSACLLLLTAFPWPPTSLLAQELSSAQRQTFERCRSLQGEGDLQGARRLARELVGAFEAEPASRYKLVFSNELANLDQRLGDYGEATRGYESCLAIAESLSDKPDVLQAQLKNNLAALLQVLGQFEKAESLSKESLELRRSLEGKDSEKIVPALNNLAGLYWCIGDLAAAESHYREALAIREGQLGQADALTALSQANLGGVLFYRNRNAEAEPLVEKAIATLKKSSGPDHPDTLDALLFLGEIERAKGNPEAALSHYRKCVEGRERAFGTRKHVEVAEAERRMGDALRELKRYDEAKASYAASDEHYEAVLRADHLDLLAGTYGAGLCALASGDRAGALRQAAKALQIEKSNLDGILRFTDERQRLAYQDMFRSIHLLANLGAAREVADFQLLTKGIVLDSLIGEARLLKVSDDPKIAAEQQALRDARARFRTAFLGREQAGGAASLAEATAAVATLLRSLNAQLGTMASQPGLPTVTSGEVQKALAPGEALVDYLVFDSYEGGSRMVRHYGAVVVTVDEVRFHDCGAAAEIDAKVERIAPLFSSSRPDNEAADLLMRELYRAIIIPLRPSLTGIRTLLVSPAAQLHFVPFACLLDENDRFVAESFQVDYLSTGRAVLDTSAPPVASGEALLIGNPTYDTGDARVPTAEGSRGMLATYGASTLAMVAGKLTQLPGTAREVEALSAILEGQGLRVNLLKESRAGERAFVEAVRGPKILHFATHGIYLGVLAPRPGDVRLDAGFAPDELAGFQNPMFESWIALAGARNTVADWSKGVIRPSGDDGILMANEAAELNLRGTELVTLSACDTAVGESTKGDGVLGLRRGFQLAGARNVMTTLWPIDDDVTVGIMKEFYTLLAESDPETALARVQREWLPRLRSEKGIKQAITLAGPFLLGR